MSPAVYIDHKGRHVTLGKQLGRGGEAAVFAIEEDPSLVAKIYYRPLSQEKNEKLSRMINLQSERLLKFAAWPIGTLRSRNGNSAAGILMRSLGGFKDIHALYNVKSRIREFPAKANWRFLIQCASNIARSFAVIHEHKHVIGDVNQRNVRVSPDSAIVGLIDCDSFQIYSNGHYFLCGVGVPEYTPPELQHKQFNSLIRTPNHDNFGLAVLIFHLLFMGRHPFAGTFFGRGEMPIERAIEQFRFAFAPDSQRTQMQPPPNCITLAHVPPDLRSLFVDAFASTGVENRRPDPVQWVTALDALARQLAQCPGNAAHVFFKGLSACPWCPIEAHAGVLLFVAYAVAEGTSHFKLEMVWGQIASVPSPGPSGFPDFAQLTSNIGASLRAKAAGWKRKGQIAVVVLVTVAIIGLCLAAGFGAATFWVGFVCFAVASAAIKKAGLNKTAFENEARATEARLRAVQEQWRREVSQDPFAAKLSDLKKLVEEYKQLPSRRQQRLVDLERDLYDVQLRHYLEKFDIASADIAHIKDNRKTMLSSFGIDDAADVTAAAVEAVPGFGQFLTGQMMAWRSSIEAKFRFDPKRGIDAVDVRRVDQEIAKRRLEIELTLSRGQAELAEIRRRILIVRGQFHDQLHKAWSEMAQAQANARAA